MYSRKFQKDVPEILPVICHHLVFRRPLFTFLYHIKIHYFFNFIFILGCYFLMTRTF